MTHYSKRATEFCNNAVNGLIRQLVVEKHTHDWWINQKIVLTNRPEWQKISVANRHMYQGMLLGAERMLEVAGLVVWAHFYQGYYRTPAECREWDLGCNTWKGEGHHNYIRDIDNEQSTFIWCHEQYPLRKPWYTSPAERRLHEKAEGIKRI